jgi:glycosyltransferase involved in cell wall biosynthesis
MQILQVITDTDRRGAQTFAMDLGDALRAEGESVRTVALAPGKQSSPLNVEILGARRRGPATLRALRSKMKTSDVTIAHGGATLMACAIAGFPGERFVYRQISDSRFWANNWKRRLRTALSLRRASQIVALSEEAQQTLIDHVWAPRSRLTVIPNGVPIGEFRRPTPEERSRARLDLGLVDESYVVLSIGALVPEKGVDIAIDALAELEDPVLVVAGDGPDRERLELRAENKLSRRYRFVGAVDHPFGIYACADVVVLPSKGGDSMPATLIEAGLCGLPAIATPVGSIEDVVVDGATGLIITPNDIGNLRQAIERLMDNPELAELFGATAAARCQERFEIEAVARRWLTTLRLQG